MTHVEYFWLTVIIILAIFLPVAVYQIYSYLKMPAVFIHYAVLNWDNSFIEIRFSILKSHKVGEIKEIFMVDLDSGRKTKIPGLSGGWDELKGRDNYIQCEIMVSNENCIKPGTIIALHINEYCSERIVVKN